MKLIESLKVDKKRLQQITTAQIQSVYELSGSVRDSFENRDSLLYVEHIIPKQFWFIKWGVKERRQEIVSRNSHTQIIGAEFISIRK